VPRLLSPEFPTAQKKRRRNVAAQRRQEFAARNIPAAAIGKLKAVGSNTFKLLRLLNVPLEFTVGVTQELIDRAKGRASISLWTAGARGVRDRKTWTSVVGNPWIGVPMDFVIDPVNLLGIGIVRRAVSAPLRFGGRALSRGGSKIARTIFRHANPGADILLPLLEKAAPATEEVVAKAGLPVLRRTELGIRRGLQRRIRFGARFGFVKSALEETPSLLGPTAVRAADISEETTKRLLKFTERVLRGTAKTEKGINIRDLPKLRASFLKDFRHLPRKQALNMFESTFGDRGISKVERDMRDLIQEWIKKDKKRRFGTYVLVGTLDDPHGFVAVDDAMRGEFDKLVPSLPKGGREETIRSMWQAAEKSLITVQKIGDFIGGRKIKEYWRAFAHKPAREALDTLRGDVAVAIEFSGKEMYKKVSELVPDIDVQQRLAVLLEMEGVVKADKSGRLLSRFYHLVNTLTPNEKKAYDTASNWLREIEKTRLANGLITQEVVSVLAAKMGSVKYIPRYRLGKKETTDLIQAAIAAVEDGGKKVELALGHKLDELKDMLKQAKSIDDNYLKSLGLKLEDVDNFYNDTSRITVTKPGKAGFQRARTDTRSLEEIAADVTENINLNLAQILRQADVDTAVQLARLKYRDSLVAYLQKEGYLIPKEAANDRGALILLQNRLRRAGRKADLVREFDRGGGFVELKGRFKTLGGETEQVLSGFAAPKTIADELISVIDRTSRRGLANEVITGITRATAIYKAWTLFTRPAYYTRNLISDMNNSIIAGMRINEIPEHYQAALHAVKKWRLGEELSTDIIEGLGISEKQLIREAVRGHVLNAGFSVGETSAAMKGAMIRTPMFRWMDPKQNRVLGWVMSKGSYIEETGRMAHFMWRLSKGDTPEKAAASVRKFLFDYLHGLSDVENKLFRQGLFPFYAWTRFNLPLQLEMLARRPARVNNIAKVFRETEDNLGGPTPDQTMFSQWLKSSVKVRFRWDKKENKYTYFMLGSWWPMADIGKALSTTFPFVNFEGMSHEVLDQTTPFLSMPFELTLNYSLFRNRPITEVRGTRGDILGVPLPKRMEHLLRAIAPLNTADRVIEAGSDRFADSAWSRAMLAAMRLLIGKPYPVNYQSQVAWWDIHTAKRIGMLSGLKRMYEKRGDDFNAGVVQNEIDKLHTLRDEHLGIKHKPKRRR